MFETLADSEAMLAGDDIGYAVRVIGGESIAARFQRRPDETLDVAGVRSVATCLNAVADDIAIDGQLGITASYDPSAAEVLYYVREKRPGERYTLLILEAA